MSEDVKSEDSKKTKGPFLSIGRFLGEIRAALIVVVPTHLVQFLVYLMINKRFPSANWPILVFAVGLIGFASFLVLDKQAHREKETNATAFEIATGYLWLALTLVISLLGAIGGGLLNSVCKSNSCLSLAELTSSFKIYALYALGELLVMSVIVFVLAKSRRRAELEAQKSASIQIAKPKQR